MRATPRIPRINFSTKHGYIFIKGDERARDVKVRAGRLAGSAKDFSAAPWTASGRYLQRYRRIGSGLDARLPTDRGRDAAAAEAHAHDSRRHDSRLSHGVPGERERPVAAALPASRLLPRGPAITRAPKIPEKIADREGRDFVAGDARRNVAVAAATSMRPFANFENGGRETFGEREAVA